MISESGESWHLIGNADQIDSPALIFYQDRIIENIKRLTASINEVSRLRPHVKTHKNSEITSLMLDAGITKFKCATIAEAEMLGMCKAPDVLLAYQPVGPKVERFIGLMKAFPNTAFSCLVDNEVSLKAIAQSARAAGVIISIFVDLNVGMNRTGIRPDEKALNLYQLASAEPGVNIIGLHAYDGHIHDASLSIRQEKAALVINAIVKLQQAIVSSGLPSPVVVAGGTPTYPIYAAIDGFECSPGTFVLWDKGYHDAFAEQEYLTAALVLTRVISLTDERLITVDLGHKSVAAENEVANRVFFLNAASARVIGQSEEHLVLDVGKNHNFNIGDVLYGLPIHICPTVALYGEAQVIDNQKKTGEWKIISRERKIKI